MSDDKRISMEKIAEKLGISAMSVSRALKAKEEPKRKDALELYLKVREAAVELGYRKSAAPRSMISGRYDTIAVLGSLEWRNNHMPQYRLFGLQDEAAKRKQSLLFNSISDEELADPAFIPDILSEWRSDGLLINYNTGYPERLDSLLQRYHVPAIWMNSRHEYDCIYPDDFNGARKAVEHLISLGHKRIGLWNHQIVRSAVHYSVNARPEGFRTAMKAAGLQGIEICSEGRLSYIDYMPFISAHLAKKERPTAILLYSAPQYIAVLKAALKLGLRIPEDLSIVCFHDSKDSFQFTTVYIPEIQLGRKAVELIIKKIEKPAEKLEPCPLELELLNLELTCAPPPSEKTQKRK